MKPLPDQQFIRFFQHYLLSLQFFTRIPIGAELLDWIGANPAMRRASMGHFPGVGLLVGLLVAAATALLLQLLPVTALTPLLAATLGTALSMLLTGALHEDGLADTVDALGGSFERQRALEIMKDSRLGSFGAAALTLALLSKVALLGLLGLQDAPLLLAALVAGHTLSRNWVLLTARLLPNARPAATAKSGELTAHISCATLLTGLVWCLLALALALSLYLLVGPRWSAFSISAPALLLDFAGAWLASLLAWVWLTRWFWRRLQGFTGDCLGATQQICELAFYLGLALCLP